VKKLLFFGGFGSGLMCFEPSGARVRKFRVSEGRINDFILLNVRYLYNKQTQKQIKIVLICFVERELIKKV
jgi:hypothetical protein